MCTSTVSSPCSGGCSTAALAPVGRHARSRLHGGADTPVAISPLWPTCVHRRNIVSIEEEMLLPGWYLHPPSSAPLRLRTHSLCMTRARVAGVHDPGVQAANTACPIPSTIHGDTKPRHAQEERCPSRYVHNPIPAPYPVPPPCGVAPPLPPPTRVSASPAWDADKAPDATALRTGKKRLQSRPVHT